MSATQSLSGGKRTLSKPHSIGTCPSYRVSRPRRGNTGTAKRFRRASHQRPFRCRPARQSSDPALKCTPPAEPAAGLGRYLGMISTVVKRSIVIGGHKTSVSLEDAFWTGLKEIAASQQSTISTLITEIDGRRQGGNLSSTLRLFVLEFYQERAGSNGPDDLKTSIVPDLKSHSHQTT